MLNDLWVSLAIAAFADYRISRMLALEEGPFELFLNLRFSFTLPTRESGLPEV